MDWKLLKPNQMSFKNVCNKYLTFIRIYLNWILINAGFCLLPIFTSYIINGNLNDSIILSTVSYSFTLIIVSVYLFDRLSQPESLLKWISFFIAFILISSYIIYPGLLNEIQLELIHRNDVTILLTFTIISLIVSFILNLKAMNEKAKDLTTKRIFNESDESGSSIEKWAKKQKNQND